MKAKIALVGAASSRKSTVAYNVTALLKRQKMPVEFVPEFARRYIEQFTTIEDPAEQFLLFLKQRDAEAQAAANYDYVLCDTGAFVSYPYLLFYNGDRHIERPDKFWFQAHELDRMCMAWARTYSDIFLLNPGEFVDDGVRFAQSEDDRSAIYAAIRRYMVERGIPFQVVNGTIDQKIAQVVNAIQPYHPEVNLLSALNQA